MSQANANFTKNSPNTESKVSDSGQLKEFRTPPHNLAIEQAVLAADDLFCFGALEIATFYN